LRPRIASNPNGRGRKKRFETMKKIVIVIAGLLLLSVPAARALAQDDGDGDSSSAQPSAQVDVDSNGDTTVTTDNGAGVITESSGDFPVEVDDANGDSVGTVTVQPDDDAGDDADPN
jgi:hypothetical protein